MKNEVNKYGWNFSFDKEITQAYYEKLDILCSCATCRNFYKNIQSIPIELRKFLEEFRIDVGKPIEQWSVIANKDKNIVENVIYYAVNGVANSSDCYEIDIQNVHIIVMHPNSEDVVHCPENSPNTEIEEPYFVLQIHNLWLPWIVEDDINECYPEPKEFSKTIKSFINKIFLGNKQG